MSVTAYSVKPKRERKPRVHELRAFVATHKDGVIEPGRGAWVKTIGGDDRRWDSTVRLARNIGDVLIVSWGSYWADVAAVEIAGVSSKNFRESWTVRVLDGGPVANGSVLLQPMRRAK